MLVGLGNCKSGSHSQLAVGHRSGQTKLGNCQSQELSDRSLNIRPGEPAGDLGQAWAGATRAGAGGVDGGQNRRKCDTVFLLSSNRYFLTEIVLKYWFSQRLTSARFQTLY